MGKILVSLVLSTVLFGCTKGADVFYVKDFPAEEQLTYETVAIEQMMPASVFFRDSLMVVTNAAGADRIQIYHRTKLNHLASYATIGKGPGEYLDVAPLMQKGSDAHSFYIYDYRLKKIFDVDLNKILSGEVPVKREIKLVNKDLDWGLDSDSFYVDGNTIFGENSNYGLDKKFFSYDLIKEETKWIETDFYERTPTINLFLKSVKDGENPFNQGNYAKSFLAYAPTNNKIIGAMSMFNRIDIMDFDFKIQKTLVYGEKVLTTPNLEKMQFLKPLSLPNSFLVPYYGVGVEALMKINKFEIHQYDYQGNPLRKFIVDKPILSMYYDVATKSVYACFMPFSEKTLVKLNINPDYLD